MFIPWAWMGKGQRERETQNPKQAPGSELLAQRLTQASKLRTVRSWPEWKSDAQLTEPPRSPNFFLMLIYFWKRETDCKLGMAERERESNNLKPIPGSELTAQTLTQGSNSRTVRSYPEPKLGAQPTEPPSHPKHLILLRWCTERDTHTKYEAGSRLWTVSGGRTHELWDRDLSQSWTLNHPGTPNTGVLYVTLHWRSSQTSDQVGM